MLSKANNILVTGGAGFIGSHLAEHLVEKGHSVTVLDNLSTGRMENLSSIISEIEFVKGSFGDRELARKLLRDADVVFHNAAVVGVKRTIEDPWSVLETDNYMNHMFFQEVINSGVKKLVFASSSEVYGEPAKVPMDEEQPLNCRTPYQVSKKMAEVYCQVMTEKYGVDTCSLRYFNIYGPKQASNAYGFVTSIFLNRAINLQPLVIFGDGSQTRDFTFVEDAVQANILAAGKRTKAATYNVGMGRETSIRELAEKVINVTGKRLRIEHTEPLEGDIQRRFADISKARRELGFKPGTSLESGLERTWGWFNNGVKGED
ncbi:hypothetical protein A3K63_01905 [Candidatus Micrarchaeota archaeon RBG_16_49_10]|nr:MAG: hypothetical protein A3K63_01905 [Candidatus Micrarchaeota archaeon RBG_16_49_10]